jgi:hypothetical protein
MYINPLIERNNEHETRQEQLKADAQLHDSKGLFEGKVFHIVDFAPVSWGLNLL